MGEMIYNTSNEIQEEEKRDYERRKEEREKLKEKDCNDGSSPF